ncbi:Holliday junction resolvase RecU [Alteribacter natronophilus]|uniref:Holliday junction resolvase RecU n=1 Tax=Alteribacter natronophilus TaxID=2583810 RepID=UPI00110E6B63|nr:Holliday junction resolvase RecU [Alteribacter natronophilus]TMW73554.1 Holliday junction resolvase RecU [Alteribacter natronophilus]
MAFRYPNGKKYVSGRNEKKKKTVSKDARFSNRGMSLEEDINETNEYYLARGIAVIHKKPTPLQIVNVHYPSRSAAVVTEAYFQKPSTTDYNGVYKGRYIDFEAKETKNKQSFPFKNFHDHQIDHMKRVLEQNGIAFALLRFSLSDEVYLLEAAHLIRFYDERGSTRKSMKKDDIEAFGYLIPTKFHPRIDYLRVLDEQIL